MYQKATVSFTVITYMLSRRGSVGISIKAVFAVPQGLPSTLQNFHFHKDLRKSGLPLALGRMVNLERNGYFHSGKNSIHFNISEKDKGPDSFISSMKSPSIGGSRGRPPPLWLISTNGDGFGFGSLGQRSLPKMGTVTIRETIRTGI